MATATVVHLLTLHTDVQGYVWYGDDDDIAVSTGLAVDDFFQEHAEDIDTARCVRFLGTADNAYLAIRLYTLRGSNPRKDHTLYVGAPTICGCRKDYQDPENALWCLRMPTALQRLPGAWHLFDVADFRTYTILLAKQLRFITTDNAWLALLETHPAWPAFGYLGVSPRVAVEIIAAIVDPRWFQHEHRPQRLSRLHRRLGLMPEILRMPADVGGSQAAYARAVFEAWSRDGNFIRNAYEAAGGTPKAMLRASKRFVAFVCAVWLNSNNQFDPDAFFGNFVDAAKFKSYMASLSVPAS